MTVVETPGFVRDAKAALTDEERADMIFFLAATLRRPTSWQRPAAAESCAGRHRDAASGAVCE
jgi:hypothetical protein